MQDLQVGIFSDQIASALSIGRNQAKATIRLLSEGATVPFISRYRKEVTGSLDETQVNEVKTSLERLTVIAKRKETILGTIEDQGKLTHELKQKIDQSWDLTELEDLYLPYKPKRKTRATAAREKGLEPLAGRLMKQEDDDVSQLTRRFVKGEVDSPEDALSGARDIMAEWINERIAARNTVRKLFGRDAKLMSRVVKGKEGKGEKFRDYFDFSELLRRCPGHRVLAIRRGESEGVLRVTIAPPEEYAIERLERIFIRNRTGAAEQVRLAVKDAYKRLLKPSVETEFRNAAKEKADLEAIGVFAENLRQLLLAPPLGAMRILAIDPGFRTGCKIACLDEQGEFLEHATIYPHPPQRQERQAAETLKRLLTKYKINAIAIGNGTAGRETESFVKEIGNSEKPQVFMISEAGASVYSASEVAREEFPDLDVTVRGAISIGRRLLDPLAELVKIDPKSIGVGQYQHDVDQKLLKQQLDQVVESCVNKVGVNLNTASKHLLAYISGLSPKLASGIVRFRSENGAFKTRESLKKVPGLGPKAFEQSAGFLRIPDGDNPLDNSAVHPERYGLIRRMAKDIDRTVGSLIGNDNLEKAVSLGAYVSGEVGLPTLKDIVAELKKPGLDPRGEAKAFAFAEGIRSIADLHIGMVVPGLVTNITKFGAFVDIGVKQDGLVHISQLANKYVSDPAQVVRLGQEVLVKVVEVDTGRNRIALSMKEAEQA